MSLPSPIEVHERRKLVVERGREVRGRPLLFVAFGVCMAVFAVFGVLALDAVLQWRAPVIEARVIGIEPGRGPSGINLLVPDPGGVLKHTIVYMQHDIDDTRRGTMLDVQRSKLRPDFAAAPDVVEARAADAANDVAILLVITAILGVLAFGMRVRFAARAPAGPAISPW